MKDTKQTTTYKPKWLSWEEIKKTKKYQGKHLVLGYQTNESIFSVKSDIIFSADTDEEITKFYLKNKKKINQMALYKAIGFFYVPTKTKKTPVKIITSVRKINK